MRPIVADSRTTLRTRARRKAANRATAGGRSSAWSTKLASIDDEVLHCGAAPEGTRCNSGGQDVGQRPAPSRHQRLTERFDQALGRGVTQPRTVTPPHRARAHRAAGIADPVTEPDLVQCGQRVGPDADPRAW